MVKTNNPDPVDPPLKGLSNVFVKIKNEQKLETEDIKVLTTFIDEFSTVSTHEQTVGEKIVTQVKEVNTHHHTHTCYKKGNNCRFGFPRPPSPYTIISEVIIHTLYWTKRVLFLLKKVVYQKSTLFERSSNIKRVLFLVKKVFIGRVLFFPEVW